MQKTQDENKIISQFVDPDLIKAMAVLLESEESNTLVASAMCVVKQFGASNSFQGILEATEKGEAELKLIHSFHNNLQLLVQKTWVEKSDETLKEQVLARLESICNTLKSDGYCSYRDFVSLLHDVVYLMFGPQARNPEFLEYALRIDPGFGIFWWYLQSLPKEEPSTEKIRIFLLLGMVFLANY